MEMDQLIQNFPEQLQRAMSIGRQYKFRTPTRDFQNIILSGLGGSGIGGSIVQNYAADHLKIPFWVNKEYSLPGFAGPDTLVIACSYSGNTEETLAAARQALERGATLLAITSGGALEAFCKKNELDCILIPGGMPPRACLGFSIVQILYTLHYFGVLDNSFEREISSAINLLHARAEQYRQQGRALAEVLLGKTPVIYAPSHLEGMAIRFRQQLNENSKMLCWHAVIPEMNHNELVGWRDNAAGKALVILRTHSDPERVAYRIDVNKDVYRSCHAGITEVYADGNSYWEQLFSLVHITDWCSVHLAAMRYVDATEVRVIDLLKSKLSEKPMRL